MAHIVFYEKPGCINNTKQKKWLEAAGHEIKPVNLLAHPWTEQSLKPFLGKKRIADCFNTTAPSVKAGELDPKTFSKTNGIKAMIKDPILIKRPLMDIDGTHFLQGFDTQILQELIGLAPLPGAEDLVGELEKTDLTTCPRLAENTSCDEIQSAAHAKPLGHVMEIVEAMGLSVTYAYEDLVFIEHNAFLIQFPETGGAHIYFNRECPEKEAGSILRQITDLSAPKGLQIRRKGRFVMEQIEAEENIRLEMIDDQTA